MDDKRRNNQLYLAFGEGDGREASCPSAQGTESSTAARPTERPAKHDFLMEAICHRDNLQQALARVRASQVSAGVDGMTVEQLPDHLKAHWPTIREQLFNGRYRPAPVKRVEIPKPDGGKRKLGIPTVLDRFIQQAILQVLSPIWEPTFSEQSYGFRPGRSAHQAVSAAQAFIAEGRGWVVDLDLEQFFDRVNHDRLMARLAHRVADKRLLKLIRAYLKAGVMENDLVTASEQGAPQGGPLSPLLSNIVLDELDRELEKRGHAFVRYADDCNIYVHSERAGQRVMASISDFITRKLKLKVNREKSAVDRPSRRQLLGFSFTGGRQPKRRIAPKSLRRCKQRIRELTRRTRSVNARRMVGDVAVYLRGWIGYFGFCQTPSVLRKLNAWIRRRLRAVAWQQWRRGPTRYARLRRPGLNHDEADRTARVPSPWRASQLPGVQTALPNALWSRLGLPPLETACHA